MIASGFPAYRVLVKMSRVVKGSCIVLCCAVAVMVFWEDFERLGLL
jgi:hypothetical protein